MASCSNILGSPTTADVEYVRRVYDQTLDWYKVAETKAQLLLGAIGLFLTVLGGTVFGKVDDLRALSSTFGVETWLFLAVWILAASGAVLCATRSLLSLHGHAIRDFANLHVDPAAPLTYRPEVLWYFGHLANLPHSSAAAALGLANQST
jgi:hypothetical protein